jgi:hypothetical protein
MIFYCIKTPFLGTIRISLHLRPSAI